MTESYKPTLMQLEFSLAKKIAMTVGLMLALMVFVYSFGVPNPNMVLIAGLVFCSALFGFGGGIVAAVLMVGYTLFFFSTDHCFVRFTPENTQKVVVTLIGVAADMLLVCQLKRVEVQAFREVLRLTEKLHQENELLQSMSLTDALTGIRNRLALRQDYDSYLHRKASVMMMDLNDFKRINDTLGHSEGDRVLRETGQLLADAFGAQHCYRYGGDEFLVIVPDLPEQDFQKELDVVLHSPPIVTMNGQSITVGYAVGYVHAMVERPETLRNLISTADERMYQFKREKKQERAGRLHTQSLEKAVAALRAREYTVDELRTAMEGLSENYDLVRVVDPIECRVLNLQGDGSVKRDEHCYGVWHSEQRCINCSSAAACRTRRGQKKTELFENQTYDIQSNPVSLKLSDGTVYDAVVELIRIDKDNVSGDANDRAAENVGGRSDHYQALHDSLTGALNASAFYELSREMIGKNPEISWVMITGDIMHFRLVNTLFGVQRGNEVLIHTASSLRAIASQANGLCGRLGGDQFAVLIPASAYQEEALLNAAQTLAADFSSGVYTLSIHFGVYQIEDASIPVSVMCGRANSALYTIRENLARTVACFDDKLMQKTLQEQMIISTFDEALKRGEFEMHLQPLVKESGEVIGAEALARWRKSDGSMVMPGAFIEVLEHAGLIQKLDQTIWEQAVKRLSLWKGTELENLFISVNISAKDFYSIDVYEVLTQLVEEYDVDSRLLRLEITETALLVEPERSCAVISKLRDRGFPVEIDDFGKGHSSLGLLKDIHADVLKIDMSFLREIQAKERSRTILASIINMASTLGMEVITEGIETQEQLRILSHMGCTLFQGYYFSRPIPVEAFEAKFAQVQLNTALSHPISV